MGICNKRFNQVLKEPVQVKVDLPGKHQLTIPPSLDLAISESALSAEQEFHQSLRSKLKKPMTLAEMEKAMREAFNLLENTYKYNLSPTEAHLYTEFTKKLEETKDRCRAKEVYYRYINDRNSYEFYVKLKKSLLSDLFSGSLQSSELVSKYQTSSKGTFDLQGLQEIHEIHRVFPKGEEAVNQLLKEQNLKDLAQLDAQYQEAMIWAQENEILGLLVLKSPVNTQNCSKSFDRLGTKNITSSTNDVKDNSLMI